MKNAIGFLSGFTPRLVDIANDMDAKRKERIKREQERKALASLLDRYTKSQSNINERYKTGEPTTIPGGEVTTPNISALPTQNVSSMGRSADFNIPRGTESSTYNLNERPQNRMVSNILNPNAIPIEPQSGNSYRPTNKIMDISVEDLRKLANSDIELPEGGIRRNAPQQGIVPDTTMQMPDDIFLGDISEIPQEERYGKAVNEANTFLAQGLSDQDLDLGRLQVLANALNQKAAGLKPKEFEPFSMSPGEKRAVRLKKNPQPGEDPYEWVENPKPEERKPFDIEGSMENDKTGTYWTYDKQTGQFIDTKVPFTRDVRKRTGGGSDKDEEEARLKDTVSPLIANIKNFEKYQKDPKTGEYLTDGKGNKIPKTSLEENYEKDLLMEKINLQLLSPRAYQWLGNINKMWNKKYLTPKELKDEALKHAESENLSEDEQNELATYLKYYQSIYPGLKQ
jgi:hypothetical protein